MGKLLGQGLVTLQSLNQVGLIRCGVLVHPESYKPPPKKKKKNGKCQITPISFDVTKKWNWNHPFESCVNVIDKSLFFYSVTFLTKYSIIKMIYA